MPLIEPGTIMIDEDEAMKNCHYADHESTYCPKCGLANVFIGANFCHDCGQKLVWFTKETI